MPQRHPVAAARRVGPVADGDVGVHPVGVAPDGDAALPGIGRWSVHMLLMFSLGRLDVLPLGDLALRKSIAQHYALPDKPAIADYHAVAERWRPYRTISSWYLWAAVD